MDIAYVQLCAEMAYNEVIMESYFNESNDEKKNNILDKVKSFFSTIKRIISNIFDKFINFIKDKIKELKEKLKDNNKENNDDFDDDFFEESSLILDELLTEGFNYSNVALKLYDIAKDIYNQLEKIDDIVDKDVQTINSIRRNAIIHVFSENDLKKFFNKERNYIYDETTITNFITDNNITIYNSKNIEKIYNEALENEFNEKSIKDTVSKEILKHLESIINSLDKRKKDILTRLTKSLNNIKDSIAECEFQINNPSVLNPGDDIIYKINQEVFKRIKSIYTVGIKAINECMKGYGTLTKCMSNLAIRSASNK